MAAEEEPEAVNEETMAALSWVSGLDHDASVMALIRSLPPEVVVEQIASYRAREKTPVADAPAKQEKVELSKNHNHQQRMLVAARFHLFLKARGIQLEKRMPYGSMKTFIHDNIKWASKLPPRFIVKANLV